MMDNYSSDDDSDRISYASSNNVTVAATDVPASDVTETKANNTNNTRTPEPISKPPTKKKVSYASTQPSSEFLMTAAAEVSSLNDSTRSYTSILRGVGGGGGGDGRNNNNNKGNSDFNSSAASLLASSFSSLTSTMRGISNSKSKRGGVGGEMTSSSSSKTEIKKEARSNSKKHNKATYDDDVMIKDLNEWVGKTKQSCNSVTVSKVVPVVLVVLNICDYTSSQSCRHALFCLVSLNAGTILIHSFILVS